MTASKMAFLAVIAVGLIGSAAPGTADEDIDRSLTFEVKAVQDQAGSVGP